jgi:predicted enzyme related to lactoylglutathione lyase
VADLLVNIDVDDLEKGLRFYADGLGLKPGRRLGADAREMLGASSPIYLLASPGGTPPFAAATAGRDYRRHWTPVHLDLAVEDIEAAVARAVSAGATLEGTIEERAWGLLARLADPFGNGFCILQFKGRGYDALAGEPPSGSP